MDAYPTLSLRHSVISLQYGLAGKGLQAPSFDDLVPEWLSLKPVPKGRDKNAPYSVTIAGDVTLAEKLGILSNRALAALNYTKLKRSGAFPHAKG